jgi:hypothetical protein
MAGSCECGNEPAFSIGGGESLDELSDVLVTMNSMTPEWTTFTPAILIVQYSEEQNSIRKKKHQN